MNKTAIKKKRRILTLGDGDFTFSLDLRNYCSELIVKPAEVIHIVATSFDNEVELVEKYVDVKSTLNKLKAPVGTINSEISLVHKDNISLLEKRKRKYETSLELKDIEVQIFHGVNAIISATSGTDELQQKILEDGPFDEVIFNHPHLGTENASLHNKFLSHFFHSCVNHWLSTDGMLHLSLATGQCERWQTLEAASSQGLKLFHRAPFQSPKPNLSAQTFTPRRHQSGKSFSTRTEGSEIFSFVTVHQSLDFNLEASWFLVSKEQSTSSSHKNKNLFLGEIFICQYCDKCFKEDRSRKNHVVSMHMDSSGNINDTKSNEKLECTICKEGPYKSFRIFSSREALDDHVRAKHTLHVDIKPDWIGAEKVGFAHELNEFGKCSICNFLYTPSCGKLEHENDFVPTQKENELSMTCLHCNKTFREKRALLQHENFCLVRVALK